MAFNFSLHWFGWGCNFRVLITGRTTSNCVIDVKSRWTFTKMDEEHPASDRVIWGSVTLDARVVTCFNVSWIKRLVRLFMLATFPFSVTLL